jgi:hypothetical protein
MGMLKQAFNMVAHLHSRAATQKRGGSDYDKYSPIRITPSNYFRFLDGPSATVIHGREFLIPLDTVLGMPLLAIQFGASPTLGDYTAHIKIESTTHDIGPIAFDDDIAAVSAFFVAIAADAQVAGTPDDYTVLFPSASLVELTSISHTTDTTPVGATSRTALSPVIKRGDKIIDTTLGHMAIDEIIEVVDLGGDIMGYRVRCED